MTLKCFCVTKYAQLLVKQSNSKNSLQYLEKLKDVFQQFMGK